MKQFRLVFLVIFTVLYSANAMAQELIVEEKKVKEFTAIEAAQGIVVYISEGDSCKVVVEGDSNILSSVITEVHGDVLKLGVDDRFKKLKFKKSVVNIKVTMPKMKALTASGGSRVVGLSTFSAPSLTIAVNTEAEVRFEKEIETEILKISTNNLGKFISTAKTESKIKTVFFASTASSEIHFNLINVEFKIECNATNKGSITVGGKANEAIFTAITSSELKLKDLTVSSVNVIASSKAYIQLRATESLIATATSNGIIQYSGKPKTLVKEATQGGRIR